MILEDSTDVVTWERVKPGIMVVTMNRGPANALGVPLLDGLRAACDAAETGGDVQVMIIRSAIDRFFAAGADITHLGTIVADSFIAYDNKMTEDNDRWKAAHYVTFT